MQLKVLCSATTRLDYDAKLMQAALLKDAAFSMKQNQNTRASMRKSPATATETAPTEHRNGKEASQEDDDKKTIQPANATESYKESSSSVGNNIKTLLCLNLYQATVDAEEAKGI